jgi:hypothetical protein
MVGDPLAAVSAASAAGDEQEPARIAGTCRFLVTSYAAASFLAAIPLTAALAAAAVAAGRITTCIV